MGKITGYIHIYVEFDEEADQKTVDKIKSEIESNMLDLEIAFENILSAHGVENQSMHPLLLDEFELEK